MDTAARLAVAVQHLRVELVARAEVRVPDPVAVAGFVTPVAIVALLLVVSVVVACIPGALSAVAVAEVGDVLVTAVALIGLVAAAVTTHDHNVVSVTTLAVAVSTRIVTAAGTPGALVLDGREINVIDSQIWVSAFGFCLPAWRIIAASNDPAVNVACVSAPRHTCTCRPRS